MHFIRPKDIALIAGGLVADPLNAVETLETDPATGYTHCQVSFQNGLTEDGDPILLKKDFYIPLSSANLKKAEDFQNQRNKTDTLLWLCIAGCALTLQLFIENNQK